MNDRYYYTDIKEVITQLILISTKTESIAIDMIHAGTQLSGFEGKSADAFRERFSNHYTWIKEEQIRCREYAFRMIERVLQIFLDVDNQKDAIIFYSRLEENDRGITRYYYNMEEDMLSYNQLTRRLWDTGVELEEMPVDMVRDEKHDLHRFNQELKEELEDADHMSSRMIRSCLGNYEKLIVHILALFETSVQRRLVSIVSSGLSMDMTARIEKDLLIENEKQEFELYLKNHKSTIMIEMKLRDEEAYEEYVKNQLIVLLLLQEYRGAVAIYENMTLEEKLRSYPLQSGNPSGELLFLSQLDGFSFSERKKILRELKKGNGLSDAALSEILGKSRPLPSWNPCAEIIGMIYNASKANMSLADVAEELEHQRVNQVMQVLNMMAISSVTDRIINDSNPLPSYENLDPRVRLDLAEIHSRNGFKSYDYIPISQESLQRTLGEVIPSLNAVPVEGVGDAVDDIAKGVVDQADIINGSNLTREQRLDTFDIAKEQAIAEYLEDQGRITIANELEGAPGAGRQGDAFVDNIKTEFKTLESGASSTTIKQIVNDSIRKEGQARNIIIDLRNTSLTLEEAEQGVFRALGISRGKIDFIEVIGKDFFFGYGPR